MPRYGTVNPEYAAALATCPPEDDGPVFMVNLMRYRQVAEYRRSTDGSPAEGEAISGAEADDRYAPTDVLADIGAVVAFVGPVVDGHGTLASGHPERWDRIAVVRYPTRRSFIEMQSRNDFRAKHVHKDAGMEFTVVMGCLPALPGVAPGGAPRGTAVRWEAYDGAAPAAAAGAVHADLRVEGTIIGDERRYGTLRLVWDTAAAAPAGHHPHLVLMTAPSVDRWSDLLGAWHAG